VNILVYLDASSLSQVDFTRFKAAAIDQRAVSTGKERGTLLTEAISG
jgi:hypothetical protein